MNNMHVNVYIRQRPKIKRKSIVIFIKRGETALSTQIRTLPLRPQKRICKQLLHREVVEQYSTQNGNVPDIMACAAVVE